MTRPLPSEGSAPNGLCAEPIAANDDLSLAAVLNLRAEYTTFAIVGDDGLERERGRRFGPQYAERADLYAYAVTAMLGIPLTFSFAPEIHQDA
jgi:hypothetical protein